MVIFLLAVVVICALSTLFERFPRVDDALAQFVIAFQRMRLAGGFRPFEGRHTILFGQVDLNHTKTFLNFNKLGITMDAGIDTTVFSIRLGLRDKMATDSSRGNSHLSLWGGVMWQDLQSVLPGRIDTLGLDFKVEPEARDPWNLIIGGRLEIAKNFDLMVEAGLLGRRSLLLTMAFRF